MDPARRTIVSVVRGGTPAPTLRSVTSPASSQAVKAERLNRAPISKDLIRVALPATRETTLRNGLTLPLGATTVVQ